MLGPIARYVWHCPTSGLVERYRRYVRPGHIDVGPGTGYFLEQSGLPDGSAVTIVDPNPNVLRHARRCCRLARRRSRSADRGGSPKPVWSSERGRSLAWSLPRSSSGGWPGASRDRVWRGVATGCYSALPDAHCDAPTLPQAGSRLGTMSHPSARPRQFSCSVVRPDRARRSARCRFAVLGRTPTSAASSGTEPPAATKASRTSTCLVVCPARCDERARARCPLRLAGRGRRLPSGRGARLHVRTAAGTRLSLRRIPQGSGQRLCRQNPGGLPARVPGPPPTEGADRRARCVGPAGALSSCRLRARPRRP